MPRPLRIEYEGAWYHVMNRGANHQLIYLGDQHRHLFLDLLEDISLKFLVEIHGYCLMDNHYHLLIHTPLANLGKAMRHLDGIYTQRFNRLEKRDGPLFKGRYKAILIEEETYLLQVSRYIHLNPVSAGICKLPEQYPWSSYQFYLHSNCFSWLNTQHILKMISQDNHEQHYQIFINDGVNTELKSFYEKKHLSPILGSKKFIETKLEMLPSSYINEVSSDINKTIHRINSEIILNEIIKHFNLPQTALKISTRGQKNYPRLLAMYLLKNLARLSHKKIAETLTSVNPKGISAILARCNNLINSDLIFKKHASSLYQILSELTKHRGC